MERKIVCPYCLKEHDVTVGPSMNNAVKLIGNCENGRQVVLYFRTDKGELHYDSCYVGGVITFSKETLCRRPRSKPRKKVDANQLEAMTNYM